MFDVGFWELAIIGVVALVIVGPERLPGLARTAGLWIGKARRMVQDVKRDIDREIKAGEMSEISSLKKDIDDASAEVKKATDQVKQSTSIDPELKSEFEEIDKVGKQVTDDLGEAKEAASQVSENSSKQA